MNKLILILAAMTLISCGARKVAKSEIKATQEIISTVKDTISQVSEKSETKVDTTSTEETCFEPIDSTKEMIVNGKIFKNVRIKSLKTKKGITIAKKEDSSLNQSKTTENKVTTEIKEDTKDIYKEPAFSWWWLLLIVGAVIMYTEYKRK